MKLLTIILLTSLLIISSAAGMESYQKCETDTPCYIDAVVWNNTYIPYTNQICNITIYYPNLTISINQASMQNNSQGIHNYTYNPDINGYHSCFIWCFENGDEAKKGCSFIVSDDELTQTEIEDACGDAYADIPSASGKIRPIENVTCVFPATVTSAFPLESFLSAGNNTIYAAIGIIIIIIVILYLIFNRGIFNRRPPQ